MFIIDNLNLFADSAAVHKYSIRNHNLLLQTKHNFTYLQHNQQYLYKICNLFPTEGRTLSKIKLRRWLKIYLVEKAFYIFR